VQTHVKVVYIGSDKRVRPLIAPDRPGISWSSEVELLGSAVQVVPLLGEIGHDRVTRTASGQRYSILHIASHGNGHGIDLAGDVLTKERLAQIARHVRADLVFLNACDSAGLGQYLTCAGVPCIVCHTVAMADVDALVAATTSKPRSIPVMARLPGLWAPAMWTRP
jgi:hypothetical protein